MKIHYSIKKLLTCFVVLFVFCSAAYSQISAYSFSSSLGTYSSITGGTLFGSTTSDDQRFVDVAAPLGGTITTGTGIPIGFNFTYNGIVFDRLAINNNGWISLGQSALTPSVNNVSSSSYTSISATSTATPAYLRNRIAGLSRDLQGQTGSELRVETIGSSPNMICVIQWSNYRKYAATGDNYNFQIRLYETTNIVEVVYGTMTNGATASTAQVGLSGTTNADFNNRTTTTNWAATNPGATNAATMTLSTAVVPVSGQTFTWTPPPPCAGTPSAGTAVSSANPVCNGATFTLSLTGTAVESGLSYQWQSSTDGITYTNIAGATGITYNATQSVATYYQAVITCSNTALTATSASVNVTMNSPMNCYCSSSANNSSDEEIFSVTVNGATNAYNCTTVAPGPGSVLSRYSNFTTLPALTTITQGSAVPFSILQDECDGATYYANGASIWIDYNQNGLFTDAGEQVFVETATATGPRTINGTFNVPLGATLGSTRMRIVVAEGSSGAGLVPCGTYGYGETEDYLINIAAATNCTGTPSPGITQSTQASVCSGASFTLSMSTPPAGLSGITYQWQSSADGITYSNIAGATASTYTTSQTTATYYQVVVTCTNSGLSATSTPVQVTMNSFMSCYCTSSANFTSDEEVFSVTVNGSTNAYNCTTVAPGPGSVLNRYSNFTTLPPLSSIAQGATISFSIAEDECDGATYYAFGAAMWIDFNQNGLFTDPGEQVFVETATAVGPRTINNTFNVPVGATLGNTRMRVIVVEGASGGALTPCGTYNYGETEDYLLTIVSIPPNPPTPVQDPTVPTCSAGTDLTVPGSPAAGDAWYWQTSASGTSTVNPVSGAYTVYFNGTYYVRTFNAANNVWSTGSDSVTVTNIPLAALPPSPTAAASPACISTTISMNAPPAGTGYFWQGTNSTGTSSASNAATPATITATGTYYVAAYDSATSCWSNTNGVIVNIDNYVPAAPTVMNDSISICQGVSSAMISASAPASDSVIVSFGLNLQSPGTTTTFNITVPSIPAGATITNTQLLVDSAVAINGSWRSEIRLALSGATTLAATAISALNSSGLITPDPVITVPNLPVSGGSVTLTLTETFNDGGTTIDATFAEIRLIIRYTLPPATISWWDSNTGGTIVGTGSPFETVGSSILPNTNSPGTYTFYAAANTGSCASNRTAVDITVNPLPLMVLSDTAVCSAPYILDAENSGSAYLWNDASTSQTLSANSGGIYFVDITTNEGCSARDSMTLIINTPPIVNLGSDVAFCTGDSIMLDAANTGFDFLWSNSSTDQTITVNSGGNYTVMVTNPMTGCSTSDTILVTVNSLPLVDLGVDSAICVGDSVILDAGNPGASYAWNDMSSGQTLTVNSPATYFVFVTDPITTCYSSDTISIGQNMLPVVDLGNDTAICDQSALLLDAGYPGSTYAWNNSTSAQTLNVTAAGTYSVLLTDVNGCKDSDTITVNLNSLPIVNIGPDVTQCAGTVTLNAGNAGSSFVWNDLSTGQTNVAAATGVYAVAVTNSNGCTASDSATITINPLPVVNLGNDTVQCGGSLVLDAGNPGFAYLWYNSTTAQTLTVFASNTISVLVTNPVTGCADSDTITVTFNQYPLVDLGPDTSQCAGSITLNAGNSGTSYSWNTMASTSTITVSTSGTYIVNVNNGGCTKSDTIVVTINPLPVLGFPAVAPICLQGGIITLAATPAGGVFSGDSAITGNTFDPGVAGLGAHQVLYVYTDGNSCTNSISQTINVGDCTGIEENEGISLLTLYPNPTSGLFNISIINANLNELQISISDIQGKEVFKSLDKNISGDYIKHISLEGLSKGLYYVRISSENESSVKKLIIN